MEIKDEQWRIWTEISKGIDEITGELNIDSDDMHKIIFQHYKEMNLDNLVLELNKKELFFRIENDEELIYLSIIDRTIYPRVWTDSFKDHSATIITESATNLLERSVSGSEIDWLVRFNGETIQDCVNQCSEWINKTFV